MTNPPFDTGHWPSSGNGFLALLAEQIEVAESAAGANDYLGKPELADSWRRRADDLRRRLASLEQAGRSPGLDERSGAIRGQRPCAWGSGPNAWPDPACQDSCRCAVVVLSPTRGVGVRGDTMSLITVTCSVDGAVAPSTPGGLSDRPV